MSSEINKFAFIGHYLSVEHMLRLKGLSGLNLNYSCYAAIKSLMSYIPPFKYAEAPAIRSKTGKVVRGFIMMVPMLPHHIFEWGEERTINKIIQAAQKATRRGAGVISLGGFTSIVGNEGELVSRALNVKVTSGNTYTAALCLSGLRVAAKRMGIEIESSTATVIGGTGDIGSACCRVLAKEVGRLNIVARREAALNCLINELRESGRSEVHGYTNTRESINKSDLILTATSSVTTLIDPDDLKSGAIICDVAIPHNVGIEVVRRRPDVFVFEGGLAKLPNVEWNQISRKNWLRVFPDEKNVFACLAEATLLSLENVSAGKPLGRGQIFPEHILQIEALAEKHGFTLGDFRYSGIEYGSAEMELIRKSARGGGNLGVVTLP